MPKYYHGGPRGLRRILPPDKTGARSYAAEIAPTVCCRKSVYVTTDFVAAAMYAACFEKGVVYEVIPHGELRPDPDCSEPGLSFACDGADVLYVHKLTGKQLRIARKALVA